MDEETKLPDFTLCTGQANSMPDLFDDKEPCFRENLFESEATPSDFTEKIMVKCMLAGAWW